MLISGFKCISLSKCLCLADFRKALTHGQISGACWLQIPGDRTQWGHLG